MIKFIKKILVSALVAVMLSAILPLGAGTATSPYTSVAFAEEASIAASADIIDWRYKVENYILYQRLFNYSTSQWIGEWEVVP